MTASSDDPDAPGDSAADGPRRTIAALEARLAASEARFEAIVERSSDAVLVVDASGSVLFANAAAETLLGRPRTELVGGPFGFPVLAGGVVEIELVLPDRTVGYAEMRVVATEWDEQPCLLALLRDVTARHRAEAELARRSTHDHLTGLPNRFLLEDRLMRALARLGRRKGSLAVFVIDIDDFKAINDRFGHLAGDDALVEIAGRIRLALRAVDTAARLGGDEFVLVCERMTPDRCHALVARLERAFRRPIAIAGTEVTISLSVGFTLTDDPASDPLALIAAADKAMYDIKQDPPAARSDR